MMKPENTYGKYEHLLEGVYRNTTGVYLSTLRCPPLLVHFHVAYSLKQVRTWQFNESHKNSAVKLKIKASFFNN